MKTVYQRACLKQIGIFPDYFNICWSQAAFVYEPIGVRANCSICLRYGLDRSCHETCTWIILSPEVERDRICNSMLDTERTADGKDRERTPDG